MLLSTAAVSHVVHPLLDAPATANLSILLPFNFKQITRLYPFHEQPLSPLANEAVAFYFFKFPVKITPKS